MRKKSLFRLAPAALVSAVYLLSQTQTAWAGSVPTGPGQGHWEQTGKTWKYYDPSGSPEKGWIYTPSGWYYLDPQDGTMLTGWQEIDGKRFYLGSAHNGIEGQMQSGWFQTDDGSWYFLNTAHDGTFGSALTGWQWIDGHCYYLGAAEGADAGKMYTKGITPDGYLIDEQGRWAESDGTVHFVMGKGLSASEASKPANPSGSVRSKRFGGNSGGKGDTGNVPVLPKNAQGALINSAKTKISNLGWIQYVVITFENGTLEDYTVSADGTDITNALLPVDDGKTIVKWETTELYPGSVTVTRNSDQRNQTVNFANPAPAKKPLPGAADTAPFAILTNGPVSRFDYYLDVYDKDGQVRTAPGQTTFDLSGRRNPAAEEIPSDYYAPDTLIDPENGNGEIVLKLALKTSAQKAWFDGITTLKILDQENQIRNKNLVFRKSIEETYGTTGVLKISLPQTNLFSRGRYQMNIVSDYSKATMTLPVHLVDSRTFTMKLNTLNMNPKPGEDFAFTIAGEDGATFGNDVLSPIYRVDLTMPSGSTKTLEQPSQYYEIGDQLTICGTDTDEKVVTEASGRYTVTVYANGYQTMKKSVEIGDAMKTSGTFSISSKSSSGFDAISSATISSSAGILDDSGSSAGGMMNAFLVFDHDLITNALILGDLGMSNEAVHAVLDRWNSQKPVAVMDENTDELYDFDTYLNEVKDSRLDKGEYLSFSQYAELGKGQTQNRPYQIKRVLEDGLLGSSIQFSWLEGKQPPVLEGTSAAVGNALTLSTTDLLYFNPDIKLYLDAGAVPLRSDNDLKEYLVNREAGTLTIYSSAQKATDGTLLLTPGEHELKIFSEGYQPAIVTITIIKTPELFDLALVNPNPNAAGDAADASVYYTGQDVHIKAAADLSGEDNRLRGDFMKHLKEIQLEKPDGSRQKVLSNTAGELHGDDNYVPEEFSFILQGGLFKTEGTYMVTALAADYPPKTLEFQITKTAQTDVIPTEPEAPRISNVVYMPGEFGTDPYYRVSFDNASGTLEKYLKTVRNNKAAVTVKVNEAAYSLYSYSSFRGSEHSYTVLSDDSGYGTLTYLGLTADGFNEGDNTISIETQGYTSQSFDIWIGKAGKVTTPEIAASESKDSIIEADTPDVTSETQEAALNSGDETTASMDKLKEDTAPEDNSNPKEHVLSESDSSHDAALTELPDQEV